MSMKLTPKSTITVYEFSPDEIKVAFAKELNVPVENIYVNYVISEKDGGFYDDYRGTPYVDTIQVTVTT